MFIYDDLMARKSFGTVKDFCEVAHEIKLLDRDQSPEREIFIVSSAFDTLETWPEALRNAVYAEFLLFLTHETALWGDLRYGNHLKPLDPVYRWVEFKVRTSPQVRIYGAFLEQNFFIAISSDFRSAPPSSQDLQDRWIAFWGEDAFRMPIDDVSTLLTNYRTAND